MDKKIWEIDYPLFFTIIGMVVFWIAVISSVWVYPWFIKYDDNSFFLYKTLEHSLIGLILLYVASKIPALIYKKLAPLGYFVWVSLLVLVLFIWKRVNWAKAWLDLPWLPQIQPIEFAKISIILFLAYVLSRNFKKINTLEKGLFPFLITCALFFIPVILQPDFGSIMVIWPVLAIMYFISWSNMKHIFVTGFIWILLLFWAYNAWRYDIEEYKSTGERPKLAYIYDRINEFTSWDEDENRAWFDIWFQQDQWLIAIWSWWLFWVWFWNWIQKFGYIPEVHTDFVFTIMAEELWFFAVFLFIWWYLFIGYRGYLIYVYSKDNFIKIASLWITSIIILQAFINMWVNLRILPNTWITLPFISYWGSSLLSMMIMSWILLAFSRYIDYTAPRARWDSNSLEKKLFMYN